MVYWWDQDPETQDLESQDPWPETTLQITNMGPDMFLKGSFLTAEDD